MTLAPHAQKTRDPRAGAKGSGVLARLAWGVCGLVLVLIACAVALTVPNDYAHWRVDFLVPVASAALVGALVASRQPRNPVGWFILGHALCFSLGEFGRQYAIYGVLTEPGSLPFARAMIWPTYWAWYPGLVLLVVLLPLYFPDGRLVSRGWRWASWLAIIFGASATALAMVRPGDSEARGIPNPLGIESLGDGNWALPSVLDVLMSAGWLSLGSVAVASLIVRFRHSRAQERKQLEWFLYAVVLVLLVNAASRVVPAESLPLAARELLFVATFEGLWVAIGIAILRYRLYGIDVLINRTLVYGTLTASLAALYFGGIVLLQMLFDLLSGQQSTLAVVASTLMIAALFNPLRHRIQSFIDRRFYRRKYDARRTLEVLSSKLREETNLDALSNDLVGMVRDTLEPAHVSLWLRPTRGPAEDGNDREFSGSYPTLP
jgi:hypothetical protein